MKPHLICIFLILFFTWGIFANVQSQNFLNTTFKNLEGNYVTLDEEKGEKLTILDFWATWCKPCVKSIPEMVKLNDEFKDQGVKFFGINEDSPRNINKVRPFAHSKGIDYEVILDSDQEIMTELVVSVLPTMIILDENGKVVYSHQGYNTGDELIIKQKIEELLSNAN